MSRPLDFRVLPSINRLLQPHPIQDSLLRVCVCVCMQVDALVRRGRVKVDGAVVKSPKTKLPVDSVIEVRRIQHSILKHPILKVCFRLDLVFLL